MVRSTSLPAVLTGILATLVFIFLFPHSAAAGSPEDLYTEILSRYVKAGLVDYKALCRDKRLNQYIELLNNTDPNRIESTNAKLAFWLNAYNAYTLKVICDNYPVRSINDLHFGGLIIGQALGKTIWHKKFANINHKAMSLNEIEHEIIRPKFKDPRIHFALVCAAMGCPPLRSEAYRGDKLNEQLSDQAKIFLNNPAHNSFDTNKKEARISKIFDWYGKDFAGRKAEILLYIARYLPEKTANVIRAGPGAWDIDYNGYDWSLNEQKTGNR